MNEVGRRIEIRGTVQGVGFRPWIWRLARRERNLRARLERFARRHDRSVRGRPGGRELPARHSHVAASGGRDPRARVPRDPGRARRRVRHRAEPGHRKRARVDSAGSRDVRRVPGGDLRSREPALSLPVHQLHELRAAFHDRAGTCPTTGPRPRWRRSRCARACRREYEDPSRPALPRPAQRLPGCGPRLWRCRPPRAPRRWSDPIDRAAARCSGRADRRDQGPRRLSPRVRRDVAARRRAPALRKRRDEKPFAVMVARHRRGGARSRCSPPRSGAAALARAADRARRAARRSCRSSASVAPDNPLVGLMLPVHPAPPPAARRCRRGRW